MSGMAKVGASAGLPPVDAFTPATHAAAGKFQTAEGVSVHSPRGKTAPAPLSQPSTAPSTPKLSFDVGVEGHSIFYRCVSGASTVEPVMEHDEHDEDEWDEGGLPPLPVSRLDHEALLDELLGAVKALYRRRFGKDVDDESDEELEYDADGTPWTKQVGTGPLTASVLEGRLAEVKGLYVAKCGRDLDEEREDCEYDQDGTPWVRSEGAGPITVESLEGKLAEVKGLFRDAFGEDADAESTAEAYECDADGTVWVRTTGRGPLTVEVLEGRLDEVKELYEARFGADVDEFDDGRSEFECAQDGIPWIETVGAGPLTMDALEGSLAEAKELLRRKFGRDADEDSEADDCEYDADGTPWVKSVGSRPLTVGVLEDRLAEAKELYEAKFGKEVDDSSDDEYEYDQEGTAWIKTVGAGPLTAEVLEERLAEVKDLYRGAFGRDADAESEAGSELEYDADGAARVKTVGEGPLNVPALEGKLAAVKALFRHKYGRDVDEESDAEQIEYDEDGTEWIKTVGRGPLTCAVLEDRLAEVKELFEGRFGRSAEEDSADGEPDLQFDRDGTLWLKWQGTGASTRTA